MKTELDQIDKDIVESIREHPGAPIRAVIKPLFSQRSESVLRTRTEQLALRGLIRLEKQIRGPILCYPVEGAEA